MRRQIYGQQIYKQIPKGLKRKIPSYVPNRTIVEAEIVQGKWSAMRVQGDVLHLWLLFLQTEGQSRWTTSPAQSGIPYLLMFTSEGWRRPRTKYLYTSESGLPPAVFLHKLAKLLILQCSWGFALQNGLEAKGKQTRNKKPLTALLLAYLGHSPSLFIEIDLWLAEILAISP